MLAPKMGRSTMVHSFPCREESMQNKYGLFVHFACGFCFPCQAAAVVDYIVPAVGLSYLPCLMSNSKKYPKESKQKDIATLYERLRNYAEIDAEIINI